MKSIVEKMKPVRREENDSDEANEDQHDRNDQEDEKEVFLRYEISIFL